MAKMGKKPKKMSMGGGKIVAGPAKKISMK